MCGCSAARAACDRLIVGLRRDASVRRLEGPGRPASRSAEVLAALEAVDLDFASSRRTRRPKLITRDQAERAGQGRRLHPRDASSATRSSRPRRRGRCWCTSCQATDDVAGQPRRRGGWRERSRRASLFGGLVSLLRDPAPGWRFDRPLRSCRVVAAVFDVAHCGVHVVMLIVWVPFLDVRPSCSRCGVRRRRADRAFRPGTIGTLWSDATWGSVFTA